MTVLLYLAAIVTANLTVTAFGPKAVIINAFLLIGLDLILRDRLHDRWQGRGLAWKMFTLILAGGALSYALNHGAGRIAVASTLAFALAALTDTVVYHAARRLPWLVRANLSNAPSALVDSIVFPVLAFGAWTWPIILGQFLAKTLGGALWSVVLHRIHKQVVNPSVYSANR